MTFRNISALLSTLMILCTTGVVAQSAEDDRLLDSLGIELRKADEKWKKLEILEQISFSHYNADSTVHYAQMEYDLATELDSLRLKECSLRYLSWAYFFYNDYPKSCEYSYEAIMIADSIGDVYGMAKSYYNLGNSHSMMQDATTSNEFYHKALEIFESLNDTLHVGDVLRNIGQNNYENRMYEDAYKCYQHALELDSLMGDWATASEDYNGLGATALHQYRDNEYRNPDYSILRRAKVNLLKAKELAEREDYSYSLMRTNVSLLDMLLDEYRVNKHRSILDSCATIFTDTYALLEKADYDNDRYEVDAIYVEYLLVLGKNSQAKALLDKMFKDFAYDADKHKEHMAGYYNGLSLYYKNMGDINNALLYNDMYSEAMAASKRADYATKSIQAMAQSRFNKQMAQKEIDEQKREALYQEEAARQFMVLVFTIVVLIMVLVIAVLMYRSYIHTKETNRQLDNKNVALEEQKEEIATQNEYLIRQKEQIEEQKMNLEFQNKIISTKNTQITDSINYASLIQQAALPSESQMNSIFGEHLVIFHPLNIVSGDFYWTSQVDKYKMLAVADCTGHGVPGAFLSMLGMSILNDISKDINASNVSAGAMLDNMRQIFKESLHQRGNEEDNHDGIDVALIIIDIEKMEMHYAGAFRPVLIFRDGESIKLDADRMPIGVHYKEADHFTNHTFDLMKNDVIYMYSDGMTDQFGYDSDMNVHKFTAKRLKSLLADVHRQPFSTQKMKIELALDKWRLDSLAKSGEPYEQTDDAILVGVRV